MMSYELFKKLVVSRIKEYLPYVFAQHNINVDTMYKANEKHDCMTLYPLTDAEQVMSPCIYLDDWYKIFEKNQDIDTVLETMAMMIIQYYTTFDGAESFDLAAKKDSIVMNIMNTERNRELLQNVPHRDVLDFSIVYRIIMEQSDSGYGTIMVTNSVAETLEMNEEELYSLAMENTKRLFPLKIMTMREVHLGEDATDEEAWESIKDSKIPFIVTNKAFLHGAAHLMYGEELKKIADQIDNNYYAVPSSVNEFFVIPDGHSKPEELKIKLSLDNSEPGGQRDILSYNIYYYDRKTESLMIA